MSNQQVIDLTAGAIEYSWPTNVGENTGKDISTDPILICLGSFNQPGTFVTPDVITRPTPSTAVVQLLIGGIFKPAKGSWWVWVKVTDAPEVVPRRAACISIT